MVCCYAYHAAGGRVTRTSANGDESEIAADTTHPTRVLFSPPASIESSIFAGSQPSTSWTGHLLRVGASLFTCWVLEYAYSKRMADANPRMSCSFRKAWSGIRTRLAWSLVWCGCRSPGRDEIAVFPHARSLLQTSRHYLAF